MRGALRSHPGRLSAFGPAHAATQNNKVIGITTTTLYVTLTPMIAKSLEARGWGDGSKKFKLTLFNFMKTRKRGGTGNFHE